jgi:hypothetical protein
MSASHASGGTSRLIATAAIMQSSSPRGGDACLTTRPVDGDYAVEVEHAVEAQQVTSAEQAPQRPLTLVRPRP